MKKRSFQIALLLSLFLHITVSTVLLTLEKKSRDSETKPIDVTLLEINSQHSDQTKQIVDQNEKSVNDDIPEKAKFLSRNNQKVAEETRAVNHGRFNNQAAQGLLEKGPQQPEQKDQTKKTKISKAKENLGDKKDYQRAPWEMETTNSGLPALEALKPKFDWNKVVEKNRPSVENPGQISATDDYLKDTKTGAQTLLNTREFVYFTYYNRIKNQLQQYWEPKIKDKVTKLFRQGRQIASNSDRITRLRITLDRKGTLVGVAVVNQSGVQELDEAAIEAFRAAAPFPNPPAGIVEADGTIKIDWSFILEASDLNPVRFEARRAPIN